MRTRLAVTTFVCLMTAPALATEPKALFAPRHTSPTLPTVPVGVPQSFPVPVPQSIPVPTPQTPPTSPQANATGVGVGVGVANSSSQSGATAISGQGGNSSLTVNNPANTTATVNSNVSGTTTQRIEQSGTTTANINSRASGTTTVRTAPSMVAPGLAAAGLETCLGSASGTVSAIGFGIGGGSTYADEGCQARLDSRTLFAYGLKSAAVARLCQRPDIWRSMPDICAQYWPAGVPYPAGIAVAPVGYVAPLPVRALMSAKGVDGESIRVIDGRDGVEKDCLSYNSAKQKCFHWAGEKPRQRVAAVNPTQKIAPAKPKASAKPLAPATAVANTPAVQAIESATTVQPSKEN